MSLKRGMDKEDVVHIYNRILLGYKKGMKQSFVVMWMNTECHTE